MRPSVGGMSAEVGGSRTARTMRWAWGISFCAHALLIVVGFVVAWTAEPRMRDPGPAAIASFYEPALGGGVIDDATVDERVDGLVLPKLEDLPRPEASEDLEMLLADLLPGMESAGGVEPARVPDLEELLGDASLPETEFYGVGSGNARSIVYVVDASGSMISAFPVVLRELMRSIEALSAMQEFQVVFYRSVPGESGESARGALSVAHPSAPERDRETRLIRATRGNIAYVGEWVRGVTPSGRSNPLGALEVALSLEPDAIFVLGGVVTGAGEFEVDAEQVLEELERLNPAHRVSGNRRVAIRVVELFDRDPSGILRDVAAAHGGGEDSYRFLSREELFP